MATINLARIGTMTPPRHTRYHFHDIFSLVPDEESRKISEKSIMVKTEKLYLYWWPDGYTWHVRSAECTLSLEIIILCARVFRVENKSSELWARAIWRTRTHVDLFEKLTRWLCGNLWNFIWQNNLQRGLWTFPIHIRRLYVCAVWSVWTWAAFKRIKWKLCTRQHKINHFIQANLFGVDTPLRKGTEKLKTCAVTEIHMSKFCLWISASTEKQWVEVQRKISQHVQLQIGPPCLSVTLSHIFLIWKRNDGKVLRV